MGRWSNRDQGPVYLGYRLGHIRGDSRVFRAVVYNKGAAVLHMLRRLVGDERVLPRAAPLLRASRGSRKVGTEDFRAAMEAETGRSLERFFERWIYGSTLPRVTFSYRVDPAAAGQQAVIHVEQTGEVFDVPVTVTLQYADGREVDVVGAGHRARRSSCRVPLDGTLRGVEISRDDGTLAEVTRNQELGTRSNSRRADDPRRLRES